MVSKETMKDWVRNSGKHLWIATDLLRACGVRNPNSRSPGYRRAMEALQELVAEGVLSSRWIYQANIVVFWRID